MYYFVRSILYVFSLLPFPVLYLISDFFYIVTYYIIKYRRAVVMNNLLIAFPEKSEKERKKIAKKFYHNLIDTFIECIKLISISKAQLNKRSTTDFELINSLIVKGKNLHCMAGHQFNWEFVNLLYSKTIPVPFVGIYNPIRNKILNRLFYSFRKKFGTILVSIHEFKHKKQEVFSGQYALAMAADQNPGDPSRAFWLQFFNRLTPFAPGPARGAIKDNTAVIFVGFSKTKRGYYHFKPELLTENGADHSPEELTSLYRNALENTIRKDPSNYLWSHRRWRWQWKEEYGNIIPEA